MSVPQAVRCSCIFPRWSYLKAALLPLCANMYYWSLLHISRVMLWSPMRIARSQKQVLECACDMLKIFPIWISMRICMQVDTYKIIFFAKSRLPGTVSRGLGKFLIKYVPRVGANLHNIKPSWYYMFILPQARKDSSLYFLNSARIGLLKFVSMMIG